MGINAVIRPPRAKYDLPNLPPTVHIHSHGVDVIRTPVTFRNSRGLELVGSYYSIGIEIEDVSCVVYLHGNASCQLEGTFLVPVFAPAAVSVFCFDFAGCGMSQGEFISLGLYEKDDVACAINSLRENFHVGRIGIWGRSMGAATAIFTLAEDPCVACAVCDSPFASLTQLMDEIVPQFSSVPGFVKSLGVSYLKSKIKTKAQFDISGVNPVQVASSCFSPLFLIHGDHDSFISPAHSRAIFEAYMGEEKQLEIVPGDHNSERPMDVKIRAVMFLARALDAGVVIDDLGTLLESGGC
jgi:pimeloyl-ACP methyl ester carboxylesterase